MPEASSICETHAELFSFKLPRFAESLEHRRKPRAVAIGSSSTAGEPGILPYPARLEMMLRDRFHHRMIDVLNRGASGQEAPSEVSRFEPDVFAEQPSLVIWQVGTNAVFRNVAFNFDDVEVAIAVGLRWLKDLPVDVVMMDLQYVPALIEGDKLKLSRDMVARITRAAEAADVNMFSRFALMERWVTRDGIPIEKLVRAGDQDRLHMSDCATDLMTAALFQAIKQSLEKAGVA
jgi:acyl-CoA thioesterase-1